MHDEETWVGGGGMCAVTAAVSAQVESEADTTKNVTSTPPPTKHTYIPIRPHLPLKPPRHPPPPLPPLLITKLPDPPPDQEPKRLPHLRDRLPVPRRERLEGGGGEGGLEGGRQVRELGARPFGFAPPPLLLLAGGVRRGCGGRVDVGDGRLFGRGGRDGGGGLGRAGGEVVGWWWWWW